jgi:Zn-dependent M28 family amino/carboxypeptidase
MTDQNSFTVPYPSLAEQRKKLAAKPWVTPVRILDSSQIISDLEYLSSDICEGRKPGTAGHAKAMVRIMDRMRDLELFDNTLLQVFPSADTTQIKNIVGWIRGTEFPDRYIVISAHYDHLGKDEAGRTFYGADDNASGVACLLALARYFKSAPHPYSLIFTAFDMEERRFEGAYNFVYDWKRRNKLQSIKCNLNLDMIARSDNNEIFASGLIYSPQFIPAIDSVQGKTNVRLLMGHDGPPPESDWTLQGDHAAFREHMIPFLYIGVEDHPDYHKTTDTPERINYNHYIENCNMIALLAAALRP